MREKIYRLYVEKKEGFNQNAKSLSADIKNLLGITAEDLRIFLRYDVSGITPEDLAASENVVFSEPQVDTLYREELPALPDYTLFAVEYLPGQYDQRADSCMQCVQLLTRKERPLVKCATVYALKGLSGEADAVKKYLINPVESREASLAKPETLVARTNPVEPPETVRGFKDFSDKDVADYYAAAGFAMSVEDLRFVRDYFRAEGRDPYITELKVLDTYWSDHCRHTTFMTRLNHVKIESGNPHIADAYKLYNDLRGELYAGRTDKNPCLMDIATIAMKKLKKDGRLPALDESEEINACSIKVRAEVDGEPQDWLVMFKNETHNHPTEIEPFGGAATCLGGAIRDPLSGRSFVYQAMRVTGAADPTVPLKETMKGKLPQRILTRTAAAGFSSYGNQIGLCTGMVKEYYHPGYAAKRLETGFVIGAAPAENVVRERPEPGDVIILLGGETGRDGCGGATGSSKAHKADSLEECGAEVQKGNPLTERKLQRLFRAKEATRLIKRCNDFGAGGVCVAIGELADGIDIDLNAIPKKYEGLNATELAISESQERMAVVVAEKDVKEFIRLADGENLDATVVARVTAENRVRMFHDGLTVLDLKRDMLNSAGVQQNADAYIADAKAEYLNRPEAPAAEAIGRGDLRDAALKTLSSLNVCGQKGLIELFDSSITTGSVTVPLGGTTLDTPSNVMAARLPVEYGETKAATVCAHGFNPDLMTESPFTGAVYSLVTSVVKLAAAGVPYNTIYLTLQEYFKRLKDEPARWGQPTSALLGAMYTQMKLGLAAIGGKDSMSGTFEDLDVPPTLISFAVGIADTDKMAMNVFRPGKKLYRLALKRDGYNIPDFDYLKRLLEKVASEIGRGNADASVVVESGGAFAAVVKSCFGERCGCRFDLPAEELFTPALGDIILSLKDATAFKGFDCALIGETDAGGEFTFGGITLSYADAVAAYNGKLDKVFPRSTVSVGRTENITFGGKASAVRPQKTSAKPRVFIPVFPGTNGEYDMASKFYKAGAEPEIYVIRNRTAAQIEESVKDMAALISKSQIIAFSGGFSGGDEPDGSGKFISATFRSPLIADAVAEFLDIKKGLMLGICNGFQALVKLGLLPYGKIKDCRAGDATLTFNTIYRHAATVSRIRVASTMSPWLANCKTGDSFLVPISHGEGRFIVSDADLKTMLENGQVATQYCNEAGDAVMEMPYNPNGSFGAIECVTSADGRILGKMGHAERTDAGLFQNVTGSYDMGLFKAGVNYFK